MDGSIATRPSAAPDPGDRSTLRARLAGVDPVWIGLALLIGAALVYVLSNPERRNFYNHFVWQAEAFLHGRAWIPWPVESGLATNAYFQDVYPLPEPGRALIPFPPLPAVLLMPLVAVFGLGANAALVAALLGAINVPLAWRMAGRLTTDPRVALRAAAFYGFGTVAWYAAMLGSTWFLAHVVASTFLLLAVTAAFDADRASAAAVPRPGPRPWVDLIDGRQFVAGLLFGMAALARLTTLFGAPFFVFVGGGGDLRRRAVSAGLGAVIPVIGLLLYNLATTGHAFHPGYEHLYRTEFRPTPQGLLVDLLPGLAGISYHPGEWGIEDLRYIPQNLVIMLGWLPEVRPECGLELLAQECALVRPAQLGMSVLLTSPAYLLAVPLLVQEWRRRVVLGASLAVLSIAIVNLAHFSQGWVQFGYRFSNDFAPFALVLVTLAIARLGVRPLTVTLVALSIAVNAWGVYWGVTLGW